ncbi:MAG: SDR family oxidoreductase [Rhodospirillaceae bacterium]|nr:SDR family oxidoreductase [Rhodospirillaceae bacterium]
MNATLDHLFGLAGQVAIVTGASRGIGAAIAETLAAAGATVIGVGRSPRPDAPMPAGVSYECCDITNAPSFAILCEEAFAHHGRLDILINNAGIFRPIKTEADRLPAFDAMIDANLRAAYACAVAASDQMKRAGTGPGAAKTTPGGAIVNITSIGGVRGFAGMPGYAAAKGGLEQLARALAMDLGPFNIRVNNIAPGYILTDMNKHTLTSDPAGRERRLSRLILKRHGETWEVAAAALFLCSAAAAYLTGDTLHVDGGWAWQGMG